MLDKFKIGHYTDAGNGTGVTVILAEDGATGGVSVRGAAPATRETDLLRDGKTVQKLNAVVLSGGSAFGLEAAGGVVDWLYKRQKGFDAGKYKVPIVSGASIYDLDYKEFSYPDKAAGFAACENAFSGNFEKGPIGGGTGATVSKIAGIESAIKSGLGVQTFTLNDLEIAVISVVNALGDVVKDGKIIAGAITEDGSYLDCQKVFSAGALSFKPQNTTVSCVITNAKITKEQANILADLAHDGYALALSPSHTMYDGDAVFVMASGEKKIEFNILAGVIPRLTEQAVQSAVTDIPPVQKRVSNLMFKFFQKLWRSR